MTNVEERITNDVWHDVWHRRLAGEEGPSFVFVRWVAGLTVYKFRDKTLIGMIHLPALPGCARHEMPIDAIIDRAVGEAVVLAGAGFDALVIENFGDVPFARDALPPASLACMAVVADHVRQAVSIPIGINALRNDARGALGVAAAAGAAFIRVNVHVGVAATDQGVIEGQAHQTLAYRKLLSKDIAILADVFVKHAAPMHTTDIVLAARDAAYRGLADGLIVTGPATGSAVDRDDLTRVKQAVPDRPVLAGSGVTADTVASLLQSCDGAIVGSALKPNNDPSRPVDASLAQSVAQAAGRKRGQVDLFTSRIAQAKACGSDSREI